MATINDYAKAIVTEATEAVNIAKAMIVEAEQAARADMASRLYTNCRACQAGLANWIIANPTATCVAVERQHERVWQECETCQAEHTAEQTAGGTRQGELFNLLLESFF